MKTTRYDVVFMDCQMPEMDGYEATKLIRSGHAGPVNRSIPVIAMTARAMTGDREKCIDAGMDDYVPKPINRAVLADALRRWLSKAKENETKSST